MRELETLVTELNRQDTVVEATTGVEEGVVKFQVDFGQYDSLNSELLSILGRYDVTLSKVEGRFNYYAVAG